MIERYRHAEEVRSAAAYVRDSEAERLDHDERFGTLYRRESLTRTSLPTQPSIARRNSAGGCTQNQRVCGHSSGQAYNRLGDGTVDFGGPVAQIPVQPDPA
jgi:hypothetical protein